MSINTCAILDNHRVKCWGYGGHGANGDESPGSMYGDRPGQMGDNLPYVNLGSGRTAKLIAAGWNHFCAVLDNDRVKCWGDNSFGQLGIGIFDREWSTHPGSMGDGLPYVELGTGVTAKSLALGHESSCALLSNNQVKCWGSSFGLADWNKYGFASNYMGDNLPFIDLGVGRNAKAIAAGFDHMCILLDNGRIRCWGDNADGCLGYGDTTWRFAGPAYMGDNMPYVDLGP